MTNRRVPVRHWRCYGDQTLPSGQEALDEPFRAFPSWFLRIVCDRCSKGARARKPPNGHRCNMHRIDTAYAEWCFTAAVSFGAKSCRAKGAAETDF